MPYLKRIEVFNHYRQQDFAIELPACDGQIPFRHLVLTGPNGSGKTTILTKLAELVTLESTGHPGRRRAQLRTELDNLEYLVARAEGAERSRIENELTAKRTEVAGFGVDISWAPDFPRAPGQLAAWVPARRTQEFEKLAGAEKLRFSPQELRQPLGRFFLKYLVNLHVQARLARAETPNGPIPLEGWLAALEQSLAELFEIPGLKMRFVRQEYDVRFVAPSG